MKKTIAIILVIICILSIGTVYGVETNKLEQKTQNEITRFARQNGSEKSRIY